ncbi:MAG: hypothetical protein KAT34_16060 [Candidatus Aminicenantes bacterium]|nr:hypothetical protein [Candidatus Aminicenantes bacterium]
MKRRKVAQIFQQFLIAVIVFLLICPGSLWAKREKAGAKIIVTKEDGQVVKGELLKIEENSLVLLIYETLSKPSISIDEIDYIKVSWKSKAGKGAKIGALVLGIPAFAIGIVLCSIARGLEEMSRREVIPVVAIFGGIGTGAGLLLGAGIGHAQSDYKKYQLKGELPSQIKKVLKKLKKKARFKD